MPDLGESIGLEDYSITRMHLALAAFKALLAAAKEV
jgi:hypothetical protein